MAQYYSDPEREDDAYTLPDVEIFYMTAEEFLDANEDTWMAERVAETIGPMGDYDGTDDYTEKVRKTAAEFSGWYYWFCSPGCLPDSEAVGPFKSRREALEDAREN
jgi:hypothetical protein